MILSARAQILTNESFAISSGAGGSGAAQSSCMIMSDGSSWSGGAVGVQGPAGLAVGNTHALAANVTLKYFIGAATDSLNATYGAGSWTVTNARLSFQYTLYANNNRFNGGPGAFDIYWVANDSWVQQTANPVYATNLTTLTTWADNAELLASEFYDWTTPRYTGTTKDITSNIWVTDKSGIRQSTNTYSLGLNPAFLSDITSASASSNSSVSLYLMAASDTMGICIFTGGANYLPTLSFDVIPAPAPLGPTLITRNSDGNMTILFKGVHGNTYWVKMATNLVSSAWKSLSTNAADADGYWEYTDPTAFSSPQRFYRACKP